MKTVINRVFYVDVSGMAPHDALKHLETFKSHFNTPNPNIDALKKAGFWEDLFVPVRRDSSVVLLSVSYDEDDK